MIQDHGLQKLLKPGHPVTLVLGAGVNRCRGLPMWMDLVRHAWQVVIGEDPYASDDALVKQARRACLNNGLPADFVDRLDVERHPFEFQFAFEEIFERLRWSAQGDPSVRKRLGLRRRDRQRDAHPTSNEQEASELFADLLRDLLYRVPPRRAAAPPDTLSLIAQVVRRSAMGLEHERLIGQVITFNVDDLLEREVNAGCRRRIRYALPIAGASAVRPLLTPHAIAIYHVHGFVPMDPSDYPLHMEDGSVASGALQSRNESLVFTDEQYWGAVGNPGGFASRVFSAALSGRCVFIGLSMTDINIFRWLAHDAIERSNDFRRLFGRWRDAAQAEQIISEDLLRHYWITEGPGKQHAQSETPTIANLLRTTLNRRGIVCMDIPSWSSKQFHKWWRASFLR